jgi:PilZ domain-containing protein
VDRLPASEYHTQRKVSLEMGKRREPRTPIELPVRIFGTDDSGKIFSENVTTIDVSQHGAKLRGVRAQLRIDEIIGITHGNKKINFRVKWVGEPSTTKEGQVGTLNLTPEKPLWDLALPSGTMDNFRFTSDRSESVRVKCSISVELHTAAGPQVIWCTASDLSVGGCFVEMPNPLKADTAFELALWLGETKLRLGGRVTNSAPGFGIGVSFVNPSPQARTILQRQVAALLTQG